MKTISVISRKAYCIILCITITLSSCEKEEGCLVCLDSGSLMPCQHYYSDSAEKQRILDEYPECSPCGSGYGHFPATVTESPESVYGKKYTGYPDD